jgi:hypothetical protein
MDKRKWTEEFVRETADAFRDHWIAKPGAGGVKLDWLATWRNWCRNARGPQQARGGPGWWTSDELKLAKGLEMNMTPNLGESMYTFEQRLRAAIDNGGVEPPPPRMSRVGVAAEPQKASAGMPDAIRAKLKEITGKAGPEPRPKKSTTDEDPKA